MLSREKFLQVVRNTPLVSIDLLVHDAAGRWLVGERINQPARGTWFVPGGVVYKDEALADAFARVTQAELGEARPIAAADFLGVYEHFYDTNFAEAPGFGTHYVVLAYRLSEPWEGGCLPEAQHAGYRWLDAEALVADPGVHENTRRYFRP